MNDLILTTLKTTLISSLIMTKKLCVDGPKKIEKILEQINVCLSNKFSAQIVKIGKYHLI